MDGMKGVQMLGPAQLTLGYSQAVPTHMRGYVRELSKLFVPETERGKGHASRLMQKTCAQADKAGILLILLPDNQELADWYLTFGFDLIQHNPLLMARPIGAEPRVKLKPTAWH